MAAGRPRDASSRRGQGWCCNIALSCCSCYNICVSLMIPRELQGAGSRVRTVGKEQGPGMSGGQRWRRELASWAAEQLSQTLKRLLLP